MQAAGRLSRYKHSEERSDTRLRTTRVLCDVRITLSPGRMHTKKQLGQETIFHTMHSQCIKGIASSNSVATVVRILRCASAVCWTQIACAGCSII